MIDLGNGDLSSSGPGVYEVTHENAAVRSEVSRESAQVAQLRRGQEVVVLECQQADDGRIRARLENPRGWMTLYEPNQGYHFAVKRPEVERERLLREIRHRDEQIESLTARVDRLRAEQSQLLSDFQERALDLEARFLGGELHPLPKPSRPSPAAGFQAPTMAPHVPQMEQGLRHYNQRRAFNAGIDPTLPPGAEVLYTRKLPLSPEAGRILGVADRVEELQADVPLENRQLLTQQQQQELQWQHHVQEEQARQRQLQQDAMRGRIITSNAVMLPSTNHHMGPLVQGVFPITRPPPCFSAQNQLDAPHPLPHTQEQYHLKDDGAWRLTESRWCHLKQSAVEFVPDAYSGKEDLHPSVIWK